jgi:hypothetical protein
MITSVKLYIEYKDQFGITRKDFESVQDLAKFLNDNPEIAKAVGYKKK